MNEEPKTITDIVLGSGWFFTAIATTWGIVLRWMIGRHQKKWDTNDERWEKLQDCLQDMDGRLSVIEGRMVERDRGGRRTWLGDRS